MRKRVRIRVRVRVKVSIRVRVRAGVRSRVSIIFVSFFEWNFVPTTNDIGVSVYRRHDHTCVSSYHHNRSHPTLQHKSYIMQTCMNIFYLIN